MEAVIGSMCFLNPFQASIRPLICQCSVASTMQRYVVLCGAMKMIRTEMQNFEPMEAGGSC